MEDNGHSVGHNEQQEYAEEINDVQCQLCQAGNFSKTSYWGSGTKWTV